MAYVLPYYENEPKKLSLFGYGLDAFNKLHKVDKIYAFGSSITAHFDLNESDIDIVVKIEIKNPADRGEALLSLWDKLEAIFNKKVDLLTEDSIS